MGLEHTNEHEHVGCGSAVVGAAVADVNAQDYSEQQQQRKEPGHVEDAGQAFATVKVHASPVDAGRQEQYVEAAKLERAATRMEALVRAEAQRLDDFKAFVSKREQEQAQGPLADVEEYEKYDDFWLKLMASHQRRDVVRLINEYGDVVQRGIHLVYRILVETGVDKLELVEQLHANYEESWGVNWKLEACSAKHHALSWVRVACQLKIHGASEEEWMSYRPKEDSCCFTSMIDRPKEDAVHSIVFTYQHLVEEAATAYEQAGNCGKAAALREKAKEVAVEFGYDVFRLGNKMMREAGVSEAAISYHMSFT